MHFIKWMLIGQYSFSIAKIQYSNRYDANKLVYNMHCNARNFFFVISIILCFNLFVAFFCEPNCGIHFKIQLVQSVSSVSGRDSQ